MMKEGSTIMVDILIGMICFEGTARDILEKSEQGLLEDNDKAKGETEVQRNNKLGGMGGFRCGEKFGLGFARISFVYRSDTFVVWLRWLTWVAYAYSCDVLKMDGSFKSQDFLRENDNLIIVCFSLH